MKIDFNDDLAVGTSTGDLPGVDMPENLKSVPMSRLRLLDGEVIDASTAGLTEFYIDENGVKHAVDGAGRSALACAFDDVLVLEDDSWRVKSGDEKLLEAKAQAKLAAVQMANGFTSAIINKYPVAETMGWPIKQPECAALLAASDVPAALAQTVIMKRLASSGGWDTDQVIAAAQSVTDKAAEFATISAEVELLRDSADAALDGAADLAELDAVKASLMQQASALAVSLGLAS